MSTDSDPSSPLRATVLICNEKGLHARASAKFVKLAGSFDAETMVIKDETRVDARSIMGLLMLAASKGSSLEIEASGPDAQAALSALTDLVANRFEEEA